MRALPLPLALAALLVIWQTDRRRSANFAAASSGRADLALTTGAFGNMRGQRLAGALRHEPRMAGGFPARAHPGHVRSVDNTLSRWSLTYPLPKIVLLPLFLTLFGLGDLPRVLLIALTTGYQILVVTRASAQGLDKKYLDSFRSLGGTPLQMLRHVLIPAALPDAMTALKVASGTAVAVLFMAESFATRRGLGFLIMDAWGRGDQLEMFTGILAMSLLGVALYEVCNVLETRSCRWRNFHMAGNADDARGNALRGGWRGAWRAVPPRCFLWCADRFGKAFPCGTLLVNVSGSLLMGLLAGCWQRWGTPSAFALFAGAGFLGALTTFSTFSMDTLAAFHAGHPAKAMLNIGLNTTLCLTATAAAYFLIVP
ncbi:MAG: CrcB family protein [Bilophila wadsworthia]